MDWIRKFCSKKQYCKKVKDFLSYTPLQNVWDRQKVSSYLPWSKFWPSLPTNKLWYVTIRIDSKFQNGRLKKTEIFKTANSQKEIVKILWIGPWKSTIWLRHWCGSTYMFLRLSAVSSKTGKKCFFCVFRLYF